jgi:ABC-type branched-subunit amino acid transport system substrate-binding protein
MPNMIPMISGASTSDGLANKTRYPYFVRTIPSTDIEAYVALLFVKTFATSGESISIITRR